jgi:photosystem II stability/assembly factor-like uncharacterized protein
MNLMGLSAELVLVRMVAFACIVASPIASGVAQADWTPTGPFGGAAEIVRVVPQQPDFVVAATANGLLYQSRNGGASWMPLAFPARFAGTLHALEIDPRARGAWYAGMESESSAVAGVYKTEDAGATWKALPGIKGRSVWSLALWPGDPNRIAAGTNDGVFLSADAGATWSRISPASDPELRLVVALAFHPADRKILYAGTTHLPWRTLDGGAHWESIHEGMIDDSDVFSIAVPAASSESGVLEHGAREHGALEHGALEHGALGHIYASACSGVYRSADGGASWSRLETPRGAFRAYLVAADPYHAGVIFAATSAGLLRSPDRGATWKNVTRHAVKSIAFDPAHHEKIFLASSTAGMLLSRDGGLTVAEFNTGFVNRNFTSAAAAGPALYAASVYEPGSGGIFRTGDRGLRWVRLSGPKAGPNEGANILHIAASPDDPNLLYAAGYDGFFRSSDGGKTWTKPAPLPGASSIAALAPLPGGRLLAGAASGLFAFSRNAWQETPLPGPRRAVERLQLSPGGVLAALTSADAFRSDDAGNTFTACGQPIPGADWYGLAFDAHGAIALAATSRGLFRSTDRCVSWLPARGGLEAATASAVVFHPDRRGEAFIAQSGRVFRTTDGGLTWSPLSGDGPADVYPSSLFFLSGAPQRLFGLFPRRGVLSHSIDATASIMPGAITHSLTPGGYKSDAGHLFQLHQ